MLKKTLIFTLVLAFTACLWASDNEAEKEAIIKVIEDAYMNGVCNTGDVEAVKNGFHEDFSLKGINNGKINILTISKWIDIIARNKAEGKYPPPEKTLFEYPLIDITGTAAVVKVKFIRGGNHIYTDYLLLLKFTEGWKITDKVYFRH